MIHMLCGRRTGSLERGLLMTKENGKTGIPLYNNKDNGQVSVR